MATTGTYYLNGPSLGSATAVFSNSLLTIFAADGWYSDGEISRQQVSGVLLPQQNCAAPQATIYISDTSSDTDTGTTTYKLHVENYDFSGFLNMVISKNNNAKNAAMTATVSTLYSFDLSIPNTSPYDTNFFGSGAVNLPIGVYDCEIQLFGAPISGTDFSVDSSVGFGYSTDYYSSIVNVGASYIVLAS